MIEVKLLNSLAKLPVKAHPGDAGFDVFSVEEKIISPLSRVVIKTGISLALPQSLIEGHDYYFRVAPRSGLAVKNGIDVLAGVVDSSYRGELLVALFNSSDKSFKVEVGMRIAQIIPTLFLVDDLEIVDELSDSERSIFGFGSSGLK
jgi:dUTP pyrophosphatase